jgi:23S rRNA pseudouridine1911/1915/1917 synthase
LAHFVDQERPGIVHRLDKDTSGLMVAAKSEAAHHGLSAQFAAHTLARAYRALVWGCPEPRQGEIEGAIGRNPHDRKSMALVGRGGKPALTRYRVLSVYAQGALSLIECRLATGRTHQIRVHMTSRGHPLVGDSLYGRGRGRRLGALPAVARPVVGDFPRQALHATLLGFRHPTKGLDLCFESLIPTDISGLLEFLDRL